jgi:peptide-methionine (S)-S-oxide reductase
MQRRIEIITVFLALSCFAGLYTFALNKSPSEEKPTESATFAAGCFWCVQQFLDQVDGVISTRSGYTGGQKENPTYEEVSAGKTGHAEAVEVIFDPRVVPYQRLLDVFWRNVDPTVKDQQFCDIGTQYRSAIFYHNDEQKKIAEESKKHLIDSGRFNEIYTEILPAGTFYEAEKYHQSYYKKNPFRYKVYKYLCGREKKLEEVWGGSKNNKKDSRE